MNSFFDLDNPAWRFISKFFDACFLSVIYLIFCIPIFTIGAANSALYYVFLKLAKDEEGYLIRDFIKAFKQNFKQGTIVGIFLTFVGIILIVDIYWFRARANILGSQKDYFMYYIFWVIFLVYSVIYLYIFPLIAKFENSTKNMFKFSFIMSIKHLGWTTLMVILGIVIILSASRIPPILIFIPGILAFFNSYIFNHIFDIYIRKMEENKKIGDKQ
nr:DUF624 domain-containing protein [uncultured Tyzzerella sp.]